MRGVFSKLLESRMMLPQGEPTGFCHEAPRHHQQDTRCFQQGLSGPSCACVIGSLPAELRTFTTRAKLKGIKCQRWIDRCTLCRRCTVRGYLFEVMEKENFSLEMREKMRVVAESVSKAREHFSVTPGSQARKCQMPECGVWANL